MKTIEFNTLHNWLNEIVDDFHPVYRDVQDIKSKTFLTLNLREMEEYERLTQWEKEMYLYKKSLQIKNI